LGDINGNGEIDTDQQVFLSQHNTLVGEQYNPDYGVARTDNKIAWDEAHFYRECSNKGTCNRKTGLCDCYPGFEGEGCRRMSCPLDCNGHGMCQNLEDEYTTGEYTLWDQDKTQGCKCDPGYQGPDCSERQCPMGADPVKYTHTDINQVYKLQFEAKEDSNMQANAEMPNGATFFTLTYTDDYGDAWTTPAITIYYQKNCVGNPNDAETKFNPSDQSIGSKCVSTPFIAKPEMVIESEHAIGNIRSPKFLKKFYEASTFLFDEDFLAEQVNKTLKQLPNDKLRAPYVWTVYNPVGPKSGKTSTNGDHLFIYPSQFTPNFNEATGIKTETDGSIKNNKDAVLKSVPNTAKGEGQWNVCNTVDHAVGGFCSGYDFSVGPSVATDEPLFRFPMWSMSSNLINKPDTAAAQYGNCKLHATCIFIRLQGAKGNKKLQVNYNYKPTIYLPKAGVVPPTTEVAQVKDYEVLYGKQVRGTDATTKGLVQLSDVSVDRVYSTLVDGTPTIDFSNSAKVYPCSRRGLCDEDTGKCECFFGFTGNSCHVRTPSQIQSV